MARVVITGMGAVTALGLSAAETMLAMREGRCGIGPLEMRDAERLSIRIGGQIRNYDPAQHFSPPELVVLDRFTQFAILAGQEAMAQSGLTIGTGMSEECAVILGNAGGGLQTQDENYHAVYAEGKNRVHPLVVPKLMNSAAVSHLTMRHGIRGPAWTVASACASSNHAMGQAFHMIRSGQARMVLTGGSESMLVFGGIKAWEGLRVMSKDACRPFSANRNGMVQGEGGAVFVFENRDHALARGAAILAEVAGFGMASDAGDIVMPSREGAARAMRAALRDAGAAAEEVQYVNAHGTGTQANDRTECSAIREVFGAAADRLLVSSTKAMHGHLIGGTGAVELLACVMAVKDSVVAPTIGYEQPDPECDLDVVPNMARQAEVSLALSNAFAFGGLNAVLAIRRG